jgi:glycosyltransferase involved in cell wall biosynthesis
MNGTPSSELCASRRPRVLVIDEEVPWPANTGKRLRTLNLLTALATPFAIDLLVHQNGATDDAFAELARRDITVRVAPSRLAAKGGVLFPLRILASLTAGLPYSVYSHHTVPYARALAAHLAGVPYDLVHCEWTPYMQYLADCQLPVVVAAHNVEWMIWMRMAQSDPRWLHRQLFRMQAALMRRFESNVFRRVQHVTAVSSNDAALIREHGAPSVTVVANGVDTDYYRPPPAEPESDALVFTGSMDWRPNQDAIRWFIDAVHPRLRLRTAYRLFVVGRSPPKWLRDRASLPPEVTVTGSVDDVRPFIAQSSGYVVPLLAGGGSRLKILEAFAMGRAVVSTTVGAEGLDVTPEEHLLLADTPDEFVEAILRVLSDRTLRGRLGAAGRALVEDRYGWERIAQVQGDVWRRAILDSHGITPASAATTAGT